MIHDIPLERRTVQGRFDRDLEPVLSVDPGDSIRFQALNAGWRWDPEQEHFERDPEIARSAPYTTPVRRLDEVKATRHPVIRQPL